MREAPRVRIFGAREARITGNCRVPSWHKDAEACAAAAAKERTARDLYALGTLLLRNHARNRA